VSDLNDGLSSSPTDTNALVVVQWKDLNIAAAIGHDGNVIGRTSFFPEECVHSSER
jgi:hypothetical protein